MKKIKIIGGIVVLVIIGGLVWYFRGGTTGISVLNNIGQQHVSTLDPIDTVGEFYRPWLEAVRHPDIEPSRSTLSKSPFLSDALRAKLATALKDQTTTIDPVLCQNAISQGVTFRNVFVKPNDAQVLVNSRDKKVAEQAIVVLKKGNQGWYMNDIQCSGGEIAPVREFTFETVGFLLKGSIPKPYNPKFWHIVYEENGQQGNVVPLLFGTKSQCTSLEGVKSVCKPDQFKETTKVSVRGQMTERGADIQFLEFVKEN